MKNIRGVLQRIIVVTCASILAVTVIVAVLHKYYKKRFFQLASAMHLISQGTLTPGFP